MKVRCALLCTKRVLAAQRPALYCDKARTRLIAVQANADVTSCALHITLSAKFCSADVKKRRRTQFIVTQTAP